MAKQTPIQKAIETAGGSSALAKKLGVYPSNVNYWMNYGLPAKWVIPVEKLTGVSRHDLNPTIYPRES